MSDAAHPPARVQLAEAAPDDAQMLFALRNDPFVIGRGQDRRAVEWAEHETWFTLCLAAPDWHRIYILIVDDFAGGALRFDRIGTTAARMSIYLLERFTGRGLGVEVIRQGTRRILGLWPLQTIEAFVMSGNPASEKAFTRAGFRVTAQAADGKVLTLRCPEGASECAPKDPSGPIG